jgi:triacylglycerol lipase
MPVTVAVGERGNGTVDVVPGPATLLSGLSPRRRVLVLVLMAAVGLVVATGGVRLVLAAVGGGRGRAVPPPDRPGPVLLVPGYGGGTGALDALAARLRAAGRTATVVRLPGDGTGDLRQSAKTLEDQVQRALHGGAPSVDVIGYSAGGVVARLWVQEHDGRHKARRVVTLGSPHHGAQLAAAGAAGVPGACPTACQQLVPGSRLLTGLTEPVPAPPQWLAVWTEQDQTVTPPDSARLDGATNIAVQSVCPDRPVSHSTLPTDGFVTALVLAALGPGPVAAPDPAGCVSS